MVNSSKTVNSKERSDPIEKVFEELFQQLHVSWSTEQDESQRTADFLVEGTRVLFAYQAKVRPADVPGLAYRLKQRIAQHGPSTYGVIAGDFLSSATRERIHGEGFGALDRSGNCSLRFARVVIEVQGKPNLFRAPKEMKSLFAPKAQRVLRVLLSTPLRGWTGSELAAVCGISPGWVTAVRKALFAQEWAEGDRRSIRVSEPRRILEAWASEDRWRRRTEVREFSSILPRDELCQKLAREFPEGTLAFTRWVAASLRRPATETNLVTAYLLEMPGADFLRNALMARPVERNGNLQLVKPSDRGIFLAKQEVDGLPLVCDAQIWLDLQSAGNRAEEQARALWEWDGFGGWKK
jgi:hypothetical protein